MNVFECLEVAAEIMEISNEIDELEMKRRELKQVRQLLYVRLWGLEPSEFAEFDEWRNETSGGNLIRCSAINVNGKRCSYLDAFVSTDNLEILVSRFLRIKSGELKFYCHIHKSRVKNES